MNNKVSKTLVVFAFWACTSQRTANAVDLESQERYKQVIQSLSKFNKKDPYLRIDSNRNEFESGLAELKTLEKNLLQQEGGPEVIASTYQLALIGCISSGMKGDIPLGLLYLDTLERLEIRRDAYIRALYFSAKACDERVPRDPAQALYFHERLEATKKQYRKVIHLIP